MQRHSQKPAHAQPASGSAMDTIVPRKRGKAVLTGCAIAALVAAAIVAAWSQVPRGLQVKRADLDIAPSNAACSATRSCCAPAPKRATP